MNAYKIDILSFKFLEFFFKVLKNIEGVENISCQNFKLFGSLVQRF